MIRKKNIVGNMATGASLLLRNDRQGDQSISPGPVDYSAGDLMGTVPRGDIVGVIPKYQVSQQQQLSQQQLNIISNSHNLFNY